ncbi:MAG: dihydrofolate reductase [Acidobacteriota bacterium]
MLYDLQTMAIIGIVAVAQNYAIGKDGKLPWHYSADLKFFKQTTLNHAVVMGFNTWKSIGKPLPKRLNIVLSHSQIIENQPNVLLLRSTEEVLALSKYLNCDLFVIGGAKTYENFADAIDEWIVTEVPEKVENADTFMPPNFLDKFQIREIRKLEDNLKIKMFQRN